MVSREQNDSGLAIQAAVSLKLRLSHPYESTKTIALKINYIYDFSTKNSVHTWTRGKVGRKF